MKISFLSTFIHFYRPFFWTIVFIVCCSLTLCNDVSSTRSAGTTTTTTAVLKNISQASQEKKVPTEVPKATTASRVLSEENREPGDKASVHSDSKVELKSDVVVQSSFDTSNVESRDGKQTSLSPEFAFTEAASQNAGIPNELSDAGPIVVTLVDTTTAELQQMAEKSSKSSQIEESSEQQTNTSKLDTERVSNNETLSTEDQNQEEEEKPVVETVPKQEPKENLTEEIPSFSEWSQKQLEEAEKKREEVNASTQHQNVNGKNSSSIKVRSKNYASPDCGAKIVAANPEAVSAGSVLSPSRDEYKLNTCTSRIWFIVELCEAIQAKKIDLANFELFSSTPKDFSVSVSDRYPSREWSNVGHFTAKDERDVQSFDLHPHLFGKYIKLEMHSHHGSEHFCPISLFRVYGTSEFEVLEKEDQPPVPDDDDDDETLDSENGQSAKNLFSSATDAVISIVKKAAEVLGNNKGNSSEIRKSNVDMVNKTYSPLVSSCTTPSHIVVCDNCSDVLFGKVFEMLSCRSKQLHELIRVPLVNKTIYSTDICAPYGFNFQHLQNSLRDETHKMFKSYVESFFPPTYVAALCNTVAVLESKVVLNISSESIIDKENHEENAKILVEDVQSETQTLSTTVDTKQESCTPINEEVIVKSDPAQIKPTKTISESTRIEVTESPVVLPSAENSAEDKDKKIEEKMPEEKLTQEVISNDTIESSGEQEFTESTENAEHLDLEHLMSDLENPNSATPAPPKESVFLRLSNRIKTLERNMSLSTQYLEELSRRYKKQVEEIQRLLNTMNEENQKHRDHVRKLEEKIGELTEVVALLVAETNASFNPLHWFVLVTVTTIGIFTFCRRNERQFTTNNEHGLSHRRKSIDVISHVTPAKKERRPSEEALKISGTYEHLLVDEIASEMRKKEMTTTKTRERKRKKRRELDLRRSNSITTLSDDHQLWTDFRPKATSSHFFHVNNHVGHAGHAAEVPVVLEESDNNPLQDMPLPKPLRDKQKVSSNGNTNNKPVRKISSPAFLKAVEIRKKVLETYERGHKKSASVDETKRQGGDSPNGVSPTPSSGNISLDLCDLKPNGLQQKNKEKRTGFKKIFKKVF